MPARRKGTGAASPRGGTRAKLNKVSYATTLMATTYSTHLAKARHHLRRCDPVLRELIRAVGPCTIQCERNHFQSLVRSIIAQQISTKAARSIHARLQTALAGQGITPLSILQCSAESFRLAGLSANKVRAITDLAEKVHGEMVPLARLRRWSDEKVVDALLPVRGIGRWTAEMFLIFSLGRLDVLPVGDLGLRAGVRRFYGLEELPGKEELEALAEPWRPYRSIATWYFWRSFGPVRPRSGE